jgi:hypothetical protein
MMCSKKAEAHRDLEKSSNQPIILNGYIISKKSSYPDKNQRKNEAKNLYNN